MMQTEPLRDDTLDHPPTPQEADDGPHGREDPQERAAAVRNRWIAAAGLGLVLLGAVTAWVVTTQPLLVTDAGGSQIDAVYRSDIMDRGPSTYEVGLLNWPIVSAVSFVVAGTAAAGATLTMQGDGNRLRITILSAWCVFAYAAFLSALAGVRWAGFALIRAMDPGQTWLSLGLAAWWVLGVGVVASVAALLAFRRIAPPVPSAQRKVRQILQRTAAVAGTALFLMPLVPAAHSTATAGYRYDELTFGALLEIPDHPLHDIAQAFWWMHLSLWLTLAAALVGWAVLREVPAPVPTRWKQRAATLSAGLIVPVLSFVVFTTQFYFGMMRQADAVAPTIGVVAPIASLVLLFLGVQVLRSFLVRVRRGALVRVDPE